MIKYRSKRAQSTMEYAMVVVCLVAGLLGMQHYIKRAAQGRLRQAADSIGEQYDAHNTTSDITLIREGTMRFNSVMVREMCNEAEDGTIDGVRTLTIRNEIVTKIGYEELGEFSDDLFD